MTGILAWPEHPDNKPVAHTGAFTYEMRRHWVYEDSKYIFWAKPGWRYDGASVPGIGTALTGLHADGLLRGPCVPHDMLYENNGYSTAVRPHPYFEIIIKDGRDRIPVREADRLFYKMMIEAGLSRRLAVKAYLAVRVGGHYPEDRKLAHEVEYNE